MGILKDYAVQNIWCAPGQDEQYTITMRRISAAVGSVGEIKLAMSRVNLPTASGCYHVFHIGQGYASLLEDVSAKGTWINLATLAGQTNTDFQLVTATGLRLPLSCSYLMVTRYGWVLIAVKNQPKWGQSGPITVGRLGTDTVYWRAYQNRYFQSARWSAAAGNLPDGCPHHIEINGLVTDSDLETVNFQNRVATLRNAPVGVACYRNGHYTTHVTPLNTVAGDYIEYVYDPSAYANVALGTLSNAVTYTSAADGSVRYIVHSQPKSTSILYNDDIDVYLTDVSGRGLLMPRTSQLLINLTHQDYGLRKVAVDSLLAASGWLTPQTAYIQLVYRHSGYERTLVENSSMIADLYKLPDAKIIQAMQGLNGAAAAWKATALEQSGYARCLRATGQEISDTLAADALGYSAAVADTVAPYQTYSAGLLSKPAALVGAATAYHYDVNGLYIDHHDATDGAHYVPPGGTAYVEWLTGASLSGPSDLYDIPTAALMTHVEYGHYLKPKATDAQVFDWIVAVEGTHYSKSGATLTWKPDTVVGYHTLSRANNYVVHRTHGNIMPDGLLVYNLTGLVTVNGTVVDRELLVPPGHVDVYLNRHPLIQGVDYIYSFPTVTVCNKAYLAPTGPQSIDVRYGGLCDAQFGLTDTAEIGIVKAGVLSVDGQYESRCAGATRSVMGGRLYLYGEVAVSDQASVTYHTSSALNGQPYALSLTSVSLYGLTGADGYAQRSADVSLRGAVGAYMSALLPQPAPPTSTQVSRYQLYSPTLAKIAMDLHSGTWTAISRGANYSDDDLLKALQTYSTIYTSDPLHPDHRLPDASFAIAPTHLSTVLPLDAWSIGLMGRICRILNVSDIVDLSSSFVIA